MSGSKPTPVVWRLNSGVPASEVTKWLVAVSNYLLASMPGEGRPGAYDCILYPFVKMAVSILRNLLAKVKDNSRERLPNLRGGWGGFVPVRQLGTSSSVLKGTRPV